MSNQVIIEGFVEKVSRYNGDFHVINVLTNDEQYQRVVGNITKKIEENLYYEFITNEKINPKYGKTLFIEDFNEKQPVDKKNILKILQSNIKGVGQKTADKIYDHFGEETLKIFLKEPKKIYEIDISQKAKNALFEHFNTMNVENEQLLRLQESGLSYNEAYEFVLKCQENLGEDINPYEVLKENPYLLRYYSKKIGFIKCDFIGKKIGFSKTHPIRVEECIYHVLREAEQGGDVCLPFPSLLRKTQIFLGLPLIEIESIIKDIEMSKKVDYTYYQDEYIYLTRNDVIEETIAKKLIEIRDFEQENFEKQIDADIDELEELERKKKPNFKSLHPIQREAIKAVFTNNLSIISGGPGTGKTTILQFIIQLSKKYEQTYKIFAPTGMASKRMSVSTGERATTIHRALECDMSAGYQTFLRNEENPLEEKLLLADECSMIDLFLFFDFLKAVSPQSRLVLIGDPDQLPSVGPGKILEDLIESKLFAHTHLSQIYRQGKNSLIVENAHRVNKKQGLLDNSDNTFIDDFYFINMEDSDKTATYIKELIQFRLKNTKGYNPMKDIQILLPKKQGKLGVIEFNQVLQQALNPKDDKKKELIYKSRNIFRHGDKVMQLTNDLEKNVFNGDIGYINKIEANHLYVDFSDSSNEAHIVRYEYEDLEQLMLAYSFTVHKSQGSEFKVVIMPVVEEDYMMLYKNLVYTAMTRGREIVIFVGKKEVLENNLYLREERLRMSNLERRLALIATVSET